MIVAPAAYSDEAAPKPSFAVNAGVESFRWEEFSERSPDEAQWNPGIIRVSGNG